MRLLLLAGNTLRSRAYAQKLASSNIEVDVEGLFYGFNSRACSEPFLNVQTRAFLEKENIFVPDMSIELIGTFEKNNWLYTNIETEDVNSDIIIQAINDRNADIVVFSGYGGQILSKNHFLSNSKYLHMHPGDLPAERGSTTIYYSILMQRLCTVTAFFMTDKIDNGRIVYKKQYPIPQKNVDIDKWYDNCVRADCFFDALSVLVDKKKFIDCGNDLCVSEDYYVIHPLLKHLALL